MSRSIDTTVAALMSGVQPWLPCMRKASANEADYKRRRDVISALVQHNNSELSSTVHEMERNPLFYSMLCWRLAQLNRAQLDAFWDEGAQFIVEKAVALLKLIEGSNWLTHSYDVPEEFCGILLSSLLDQIKARPSGRAVVSMQDREQRDEAVVRSRDLQKNIYSILMANQSTSWKLLFIDSKMHSEEDQFLSLACGLSMPRLGLTLKEQPSEDMVLFYKAMLYPEIQNFCKRHQCAADLLNPSNIAVIRDSSRLRILCSLLKSPQQLDKIERGLRDNVLYFDSLCGVVAKLPLDFTKAEIGVDITDIFTASRMSQMMSRNFSEQRRHEVRKLLVRQYGFRSEILPDQLLSRIDSQYHAFSRIYAAHTVTVTVSAESSVRRALPADRVISLFFQSPAGGSPEVRFVPRRSFLTELCDSSLSDVQIVGIMSNTDAFNAFMQMLHCLSYSQVSNEVLKISPHSHFTHKLASCEPRIIDAFITSVDRCSTREKLAKHTRKTPYKCFRFACEAVDKYLSSFDPIPGVHRTYAEAKKTADRNAALSFGEPAHKRSHRRAALEYGSSGIAPIDMDTRNILMGSPSAGSSNFFTAEQHARFQHTFRDDWLIPDSGNSNPYSK